MAAAMSHLDIRSTHIESTTEDQFNNSDKYNECSGNHTFQVPIIVQACIEHLMRYGLNTVGIFRVSAAKRRIQQVSIFILVNYVTI